MISKTKVVLGTAGLSLLGLLAIAACAGSETSAETDPRSEDGGDTGPEPGRDGAVDAGSNDAKADAPCSASDFCETILPGTSEVGVAPLEFLSIVVDPELGTLAATTAPGLDPGPSFILRYDGAAWAVRTQIDERITAFLGDGHGHAIAIARSGTVARFDASGHTLSTPLPGCQGAWAGNAGDVFVLSGGKVHRGRIARAENDDDWPIEWSSEFELRAIWGRGSDDVMITTFDWITLSSLFFRRRKVGETVDYELLRGHHSFPASYGMALDNDRFWLITDGRRGDFGELGADGGVTWLDAGTVFPIEVYASFGTGMDDLWTVGDFGRAYLRRNGAWSDQGMSRGRGIPQFDPLRVVTGDGEGGLWIAGRGIALRKRGK